MLKVSNKSNNKRIEVLCSQINSLYEKADFWKDVMKHRDLFYLSNISGMTLYDLFNASKTEVNIMVFKSKNPFTKSNGYTTPSDPNSVYLNSRKFNRSDASIAATIVHETVHCLDNSTDPRHYFGHGDNNDSPEKDGCAPQFLADLAYKHLSCGIESQKLNQTEKYII